MSEVHQRPKAPERVRANLIAAAADLLSSGDPLSMATVAEQAGVTKGAVQHHFGTREALLAAMCDTYLGQFEQILAAEIARDDGPGGAARSYVRATVRGNAKKKEQAQWRAILVACVVERSIAARWGDWVAQSRKQDATAAGHELVMRLAADGLWLSDLLGLYKLTAKDRAALQEALLTLSPSEPRA